MIVGGSDLCTTTRKVPYILKSKNSLQNQRTHDVHFSTARPIPIRLIFTVEIAVKKQYPGNNACRRLTA